MNRFVYYFPFSLRNRDKYINIFISKSAQFQIVLQLQSEDFIRKGITVCTSSILRQTNSNATDATVVELLTKLYLMIYRAIAKHLRRKDPNIIAILSKLHGKMPIQRRNIIMQLIQDMILTPDICAYMLWSRDIGGYKLYHQVENLNLTLDNLHQSLYYQYILEEIERYKVVYSDMPLEVFINIMQYNLYKIFWAQYKHYLEWCYNELIIKEKKLINLDYFDIGNMPLIVVWRQSNMETHYILSL